MSGMGTPKLVRVFSHLTLLHRFTVLGLIVTAALAVLFSQFLIARMIDDALNGSAQEAGAIATTLVTSQITAADLGVPTHESVARWQQRVGRVVGKFDIVRVKVWRPDGTVVYSDQPALIGRKFTPSEELQAALAGRIAKGVTHLRRPEHVAEKAYGTLLEVYVPVVPHGATKPVGAYEVYQSFAPIQAKIDDIRKTVWRGALIAFSVLFASLYAFVRSASRQLHYMAYHDPLTGLANRRLLRERAEQALSLARRHGRTIGLLYLDLARFKAVNDSLGHSAGDELLKQVSHRLKQGLRDSDSLVRLGGDEFAILLSEVRRKDDAADVAQRVLENLRSSFWLEGQPVHIEGNLGITLYPQDGTTFEELMKHADIAMFRAKADGAGFRFYLPELEVYTRDRLLLETHLREALAQQQLLLYYQPVLDVDSKKIVGVEALVRWPHSRRGLLLPDDFIPLAEESDLIVDLDRWMIATAARQARTWAAQGWEGWIAVNISARSLGTPELPEYVGQTLENAGLVRGRLMLEITEGVAMRDPELTIRLLTQLNALGVSFVIDDFGLGYSSLGYLKRFPVYQLKVDRSFVQGIGIDQRDERLVEAVITLARGLGIRVVAEGVERADQLEWLRKQGCRLVQGFVAGYPAEPEQLLVLLRQEALPVP